MIICAGKNELFSFAKPVGVGLIDSAINLTKICLFDRPEYILFVGSAGAYEKNYNILDIVTSRIASNIEISFLNDDSYTPIENIFESKNNLVKNETIVNSSNYITTNEKKAKQFLKYNIGIENMEFFSIVNVAKQFSIPVAGIFVITNYANKDAHKDFIKNHKLAKEKLADYLKENKIIREKKL